MSEHRSAPTTKREFIKRASYVVPAVLTLAAAPSFASAGSSAGKSKKSKSGASKSRGNGRWGEKRDGDS